MIVELKALQPNPLRDFTVDPIDRDRVAVLKESIKEDGFWGGVVCRRQNGTIQIGAGHHRVHAAMAAGLKTADVFVGEFDDAGLVRVYARENATQRGNSGTAQAGMVASAMRFLARAIMTGTAATSEKIFRSHKELETARGVFESDRGMGRDIIVRFLDAVPGVNDGTVQQQLANLKASGDYARIIREVQAEIEQEQKEALKALAAAEKARAAADEAARKAEEERKAASVRAKAAREEADKKRAELDRQRTEAEAKLAEKRRKDAEAQMKQFEALKQTRDTAQKAVAASEKREVTFDFEGVAKHLKNANQIDVFRNQVTGQGIRPYLPVSRQAALARELVRLAAARNAELSGAFIRDNVGTLVLQAKQTGRNISREEQARLRDADLQNKARHYQEEFARGCRSMIAAGVKLAELQKAWPKGLAFPVLGEFKTAVGGVKSIITKLERSI